MDIHTCFLVMQVQKTMIAAIKALALGDRRSAEVMILALEFATSEDGSIPLSARLVALEKGTARGEQDDLLPCPVTPLPTVR